jgi:hypothetical protein
LLDTIHDGERKRAQQICDAVFHVSHNMCVAHNKSGVLDIWQTSALAPF